MTTTLLGHRRENFMSSHDQNQIETRCLLRSMSALAPQRIYQDLLFIFSYENVDKVKLRIRERACSAWTYVTSKMHLFKMLRLLFPKNFFFSLENLIERNQKTVFSLAAGWCQVTWELKACKVVSWCVCVGVSILRCHILSEKTSEIGFAWSFAVVYLICDKCLEVFKDTNEFIVALRCEWEWKMFYADFCFCSFSRSNGNV